jgi:hypothetical protein
MGPDTVLVAYSQFDYRDEKGRQRKAILTRRLHIRPPSEE